MQTGNTLKLDSKIYVAGHTGLVGSAIVRKLEQKGHTNIVTKTMEELDLTNQRATEEFFEKSLVGESYLFGYHVVKRENFLLFVIIDDIIDHLLTVEFPGL